MVGGAREVEERRGEVGTASGWPAVRLPAIGRAATVAGGAVGTEALVP
jgi:hypothetical protein